MFGTRTASVAATPSTLLLLVPVTSARPTLYICEYMIIINSNNISPPKREILRLSLFVLEQFLAEFLSGGGIGNRMVASVFAQSAGVMPC